VCPRTCNYVHVYPGPVRPVHPRPVPARELFSMDKILSRERSYIPEDLEPHVNKAKAVGFIKEHIPMADLRLQYEKFVTTVHEMSKERYLKETNVFEKRKVERSTYEKFIRGEMGCQSFKDISHLLAENTVRCGNESQVEAMGSVAASHSGTKTRSRLDPETLSKEVFVDWNGPPPTKQADTLIQRAMESKFGHQSNWDFHLKTQRGDVLKGFTTSQVVDRVNEVKGRIVFPPNKM